MTKKLELTWIGKEDEIKVEPRLLIENKELSNVENDPDTENMIIHGDNLLALKALEQKYTGKVKCIYIDPPYNTGSAFEHYDDNLEHSTWLSLMKSRLELLRNLLSDDGCIFIQLDNNEIFHLKILMDEVFGNRNFIDMINVKMKDSSGVSGGGEDKKLKKNIEYILFYSKNKIDFTLPLLHYKEDFVEAIGGVEKLEKYEYSKVLVNSGELELIERTNSNGGLELNVYRLKNFEFKSIKKLAVEDNISLEEAYIKYYSNIYSTQNAQTSIRDVAKKYNDDMIVIEYMPTTGKYKNTNIKIMFGGNTKRLYYPLTEITEYDGKKIIKKTKLGNLWTDIKNSNLSNEGNIKFPNGKKPEKLIERILTLGSNKNDLVLDSFLGSGTTAAVAHKMGRRYIGIEMGEHAYSHCKVRLDKVIDGSDQGGISKALNWKGGGSYRFYELAPTLINKDEFDEYIINPEYDADMLASAVALHEGFIYQPSSEQFWKQSVGTENSYLFVTTRHVNAAYLDSIKSTMQEGEYLVIACRSFDKGIENLYENIKIKKIPQMLLDKCEFDKEHYNLNIINPPVYEEMECEEDE